MKKLVILGAGQMGRAAAALVGNRWELLAFGDNDETKRAPNASPPVLSVEEAVALGPAGILLGVLDEGRAAALQKQAIASGFLGKTFFLGALYDGMDIRAGTARRMAQRLRDRCVEGAVAELGVFRGDFARVLNGLFPERILYLFDTFEGFDPRDAAADTQNAFSVPNAAEFAQTSAEAVLARLPFAEGAVVRKGWFPETAVGLEAARFALVSLDADLYAPTLAGLRYFWPRLSPGGCMLLHDYNNRQFSGVKQAVADFEAEVGPLPLLPLCDLHGTAALLRP